MGDEVIATAERGPGWYLRRGDSMLGLLPSLEDGSVDHTITDPPFTEHVEGGFATTRKSGPRGGLKHAGRFKGKVRPQRVTVADSLEVGSLSSSDIVTLCAQVVRVTRRWIVVFCAWEQLSDYKAGLEFAGGEYVRACAWVKPDATPQLSGDGPATFGECIVVGHAPRAKGAGRRQWNGGGKRGLYRHGVCRGAERTDHPTQKPHELMVEIVGDFTNPGDVILDPFAGSGATLLAAVSCGRKAIGGELAAKWFGVIGRRMRGEEAHPSTAQPSLFGAVS